MKLVFAVQLLCLSLVACSGGAPKSTNVKATTAPTNPLQQVNDSINLTRSAAKTAFTVAATEELSADQKMQTMSKLIKDGKCSQDLQAATERFDQDWSSRWEVTNPANATTCPVYLYETSSFSNTTDVWMTNKTWAISSGDFLAVSGISALHMRGTLTAASSGLTRKVVGQIHYTPFTVAKVGAVSADIEVQSSYIGLNGAGSVRLTMMSAASVVDALIRWQGSGLNPVFYVNGKLIDQKTFVGQFSAFELVEIMDRAIQMR
jgi:hypothetical protein